MNDEFLNKKDVINAIEIALPDVFVGGERVPGDEVVQLFRAAKIFLDEELDLGLFDELEDGRVVRKK